MRDSSIYFTSSVFKQLLNILSSLRVFDFFSSVFCFINNSASTTSTIEILNIVLNLGYRLMNSLSNLFCSLTVIIHLLDSLFSLLRELGPGLSTTTEETKEVILITTTSQPLLVVGSLNRVTSSIAHMTSIVRILISRNDNLTLGYRSHTRSLDNATSTRARYLSSPRGNFTSHESDCGTCFRLSILPSVFSKVNSRSLHVTEVLLTKIGFFKLIPLILSKFLQLIHQCFRSISDSLRNIFDHTKDTAMVSDLSSDASIRITIEQIIQESIGLIKELSEDRLPLSSCTSICASRSGSGSLVFLRRSIIQISFIVRYGIVIRR